MNFNERYKKLNKFQKQAVDCIDGPVMVVAGPGTGKTELLGIRVANILKLTDTLPENILCLTFTESGANAMRERLIGIIGKEAYKVAIHTFHSFGTEVINQNGQYFYQGANFRPADELGRFEIIHSIFKDLKHDSILGSTNNNEYTYLKDSLTAISELKKSGLTSDELIDILDKNDIAISKTEEIIAPIISERVNKTMPDKLAKQIESIRNISEPINIPSIVPLSQIIADSLEIAVDDAKNSESTKPITAWKNAWFKKDHNGNFILKAHASQEKLREVSSIYNKYLLKMNEAELYDFDDMILRVVHAMEIFNELRFNLQEKYQYIMVDEFQDTNLAQMRILYNLTHSESSGDNPNILVVGDDDQAIYSFQGADISNILDFQKTYPNTKRIVLTDNYRSTSKILQVSRDIITQGNERLENLVNNLNKNLTAHKAELAGDVDINEALTSDNERSFIVDSIKNDIENGQNPNEITVITRRHKEIQNLLPYFTRAGIAVNYERRDNVLDIDLIVLIEKLARFIINLANNHHDEANSCLPEILAHPAWGIEPFKLWQISTKAYDEHLRWLNILGTIKEFIPLHSWLIDCASKSHTQPLEQMLDILIGKVDKTSDFVSPIYDYYFSNDKLNKNTDEYMIALEALRTIRTKLREYKPNETPMLHNFIDFINLNQKIGNRISAIRKANNNGAAVNIMTAHSSKGLEFETVYVLNAVDSAWGEKVRSRSRLISYPENLPLSPSGETSDERLRLFFVAVTRAKKNLHISYSLSDDGGKNTLRAGFLVDSKMPINKLPQSSDNDLIEASEIAWYEPIIKPISSDMKSVILPMLDNYKLSVTHLNNFLDVTRGGPSSFLMQNLLHFPTAKNPSAAFGTAIHDTLQKAHSYLSAKKIRQPIEEILENFKTILKDQRLTDSDFDLYSNKGLAALTVFFAQKHDDFNIDDKAELNFAGQHSIVQSAHLSGKLDVVIIDKLNKIIHVTDYKTGKPPTSENGKTEFEKIKLHKYRQQLLFYKILIEAGRDYRGYKVKSGSIIFIEPDKNSEITTIEINFDDEDTEHLENLIGATWKHIMELGLPDISSYEQNLKGILKFEQDLIDEVI